MQQIQVDLSKTEAVFCGTCESEIFIQVTYLRTLSALISPTGRKEVIPVPAFQCQHCKTIKEFNELPQPKKIF